MVSRRNFLSIAAIMLVVFFLFQFSNVALEQWNDYEENQSAVDVNSLAAKSAAYTLDGGDGLWKTARPQVAYVGDEASAVGRMVRSWAAYIKRSFVASSRLELISLGETPREMIVLDAAALDWSGSGLCQTLKTYTAEGTSLVFASLPEPEVIQSNRELMDLLGIQEVRQEGTKVKGIHLYKGFLLGGEMIYQGKDEEENEKRQDMELEMPWYVLASGTKTYMKGIPSEKAEVEDHPAVIWRKSLGGAYVFAVNGDYMEDSTGLGILSAMAAEMSTYTIYPVVNAQNLVLANYPALALENSGQMVEYYSQSMRGVFRDILWPALTTVFRQSNLGLTCMMAPQLDYNDANLPDRVQFIFYMKSLNELDAEAGLSGFSVSQTDIADKLTQDFSFMRENELKYQFTSFYVGGLEAAQIAAALGWMELDSVRTVVTPWEGESELIGYQTETVTRQQAVADGLNHTYRGDFRVRSVETALAYNNVLVDMARLAYPESQEDTWEKLSAGFSSNVPRLKELFPAFSGTTLSESDGRIRNFLTLDYAHSRQGETVTLKHTGEGPTWFILRVNHGSAGDAVGGSCRRIEDGVYLIEAQEKEVTFRISGAYLD